MACSIVFEYCCAEQFTVTILIIASIEKNSFFIQCVLDGEKLVHTRVNSGIKNAPMTEPFQGKKTINTAYFRKEKEGCNLYRR